MKKAVKRLFLTTLVCGGLFFGLVFALSILKPSPSPLPLNSTANYLKEPVTSDGLYLAINQIRTANNLPQFSRNAKLDQSSKLKCDDMVKDNYYEHKSPSTGKSGHSYVADTGQRYQYASENLNRGAFSSNSAVLDSWMSSESHKASILDPKFKEIGFSVCVNPLDPVQDSILIVQHKIEPLAPQDQ